MKEIVLIVYMQIEMTLIATVEYIAAVLTVDIIIRVIETVASITNKEDDAPPRSSQAP